ncbi:conserved hypothetical protein [Vibrio coralliirubri]|nr:conserved hypothetical protein [Vibrio coralliirubri]
MKNGILDDTDVLDPQRGSEEHEISTLKAINEALIHLFSKEGSAAVYHEFTTILEFTDPKLDVLQELHAMQAWLYINTDKRKPFEHIGHFVNGWLRRSAQAKAKRDSSPVSKQTRTVKPSKKAKSIKAVGLIEADMPTAASNQAQPIKSNQAPSTTNPFKALVQSKSPRSDSKQ